MSDSRVPATDGEESEESGGLGVKKIDGEEVFGLKERGKLWRRRREKTEGSDGSGGGYGEGEWRRGKREILVALFKRHHSRH